jgi:hypothetical protein
VAPVPVPPVVPVPPIVPVPVVPPVPLLPEEVPSVSLMPPVEPVPVVVPLPALPDVVCPDVPDRPPRVLLPVRLEVLEADGDCCGVWDAWLPLED